MSASLATAMVFSLAACGSGSGGSSNSADETQTTTITVWSWEPTLTPVVKLFEKKYPNIKVKLVNAGTNNDEYTALNNALSAGSGAPDVAQIETHALPEYAYQGHLIDLSDMGAKDYDGFYQPGIWSSVNINGGIYALPFGSGPMAFFYNKAVFDKAGVTEVPTTWDEYYEAAKKIRALGGYITSDVFDAGTMDSLIWQAGGTPFAVDDETVTIDLTDDAGTKKVVDYWQRMVDEDLVNPNVQGWTDDWNRGLNDGSIASLLAGAWMPTTLVNSAPDAAGDWRVAQMPQWKEGEHANAEHGGSTLAIMNGTPDDRIKAAYTFIDFASHDESAIQSRIDNGAFPDTLDSLKKPEFASATTVKNSAGEDIEFFGGQEYNKELLTAAENVTEDYQFLPYEVYARTVFGDYVSGALVTSGTKISDGMAKWQTALREQGERMGFTVKQ